MTDNDPVAEEMARIEEQLATLDIIRDAAARNLGGMT